ncbi:hypothetical protein ACFL3M_01510 [Patescibacteria group bacterium]
MKNFLKKSSSTPLVIIIVISFNILAFAYFFEYLGNYRADKGEVSISQENVQLKEEIESLTEGYPIKSMARHIAMQDEKVAAFVVSIAKKESNWGKRSPKLDGKDCYNYWGFRQKRERMGTGGHTCFDSPGEAVSVVSRRIEELINQEIDNPSRMVVWKCGFSCESHNPESVERWIRDVDYYYKKMIN